MRGDDAAVLNLSEAKIDSRSLRSEDSQWPSAALRIESNPPLADRSEAARQPEGWSERDVKKQIPGSNPWQSLAE